MPVEVTISTLYIPGKFCNHRWKQHGGNNILGRVRGLVCIFSEFLSKLNYENSNQDIFTYPLCITVCVCYQHLHVLVSIFQKIPEGSVIVLHACAHNPTGVDPRVSMDMTCIRQILQSFSLHLCLSPPPAPPPPFFFYLAFKNNMYLHCWDQVIPSICCVAYHYNVYI